MAAPKIDDRESSHDHDEASADPHSTPAFSHGAKVEEGEGPWLVSYADLMTLLMGFFALMLSLSTFDDKKAEALREEASKVFGGEYKKPFEELKQSLEKVITEKNLNDQVVIETSPKGVGLTFRGTVFFDTGAVDMRPEAVDLLKEIIPVIRKQADGFYIVIEGHTDDAPISMGTIASNWELSALRASTVVRGFESAGFDRTKLMALGWSDTKPVAPNRDQNRVPIVENQAKNRRVVIQVLRSSPM